MDSERFRTRRCTVRLYIYMTASTVYIQYCCRSFRPWCSLRVALPTSRCIFCWCSLQLSLSLSRSVYCALVTSSSWSWLWRLSCSRKRNKERKRERERSFFAYLYRPTFVCSCNGLRFTAVNVQSLLVHSFFFCLDTSDASTYILHVCGGMNNKSIIHFLFPSTFLAA